MTRHFAASRNGLPRVGLLTAWPKYRDVMLGMDAPETVHLADVLCSRGAQPQSDAISAREHRRGDSSHAVGRYVSRQIRPFVQYFDCDMAVKDDLDVEGVLPASIWIGLFFDGVWSSRIDGHTISIRADGLPTVIGMGEAVECVDQLRSGQRLCMASMPISA